MEGCAFFENFRYGENSFKKHVVEFEKLNLNYKQVFNKELYFELDNENDYLAVFKKQTSLVQKNIRLAAPTGFEPAFLP